MAKEPPNYLATTTLVVGSAALAARSYSYFVAQFTLSDYPVSFILGGIAAIMGWMAVREPERQVQSLLGLIFGGVAFFTSFTPISF
ncbi:MAG: hypothetical protein OXI56_08925 [bacterium]|nr:hypothetical protein [bacterium]MDE0601900.1 hypothetical protein [bacterium]